MYALESRDSVTTVALKLLIDHSLLNETMQVDVMVYG